MENRINLTPSVNDYLRRFYVAQNNLRQLIKEERLQKRIQKSKRPLLKAE
ncbi:MAG TPA: hypothetical protein VIU12_14370 [Chryseolinea sp.]|jgi:hypothetical protein